MEEGHNEYRVHFFCLIKFFSIIFLLNDISPVENIKSFR